jgi:hypothetical protein
MNDLIDDGRDVFAKLEQFFKITKVTGLSSEELWFEVGHQVLTLASVKESKHELRSMLSHFRLDEHRQVISESIEIFSLRINKYEATVHLDEDPDGLTLGTLEALRERLEPVP